MEEAGQDDRYDDEEGGVFHHGTWMDGAAENGRAWPHLLSLCSPHTHTYFLSTRADIFFSPPNPLAFSFGFKFSILLCSRRAMLRRRSERTRKSANLPPDSLRAGGKPATEEAPAPSRVKSRVFL